MSHFFNGNQRPSALYKQWNSNNLSKSFWTDLWTKENLMDFSYKLIIQPFWFYLLIIEKKLNCVNCENGTVLEWITTHKYSLWNMRYIFIVSKYEYDMSRYTMSSIFVVTDTNTFYCVCSHISLTNWQPCFSLYWSTSACRKADAFRKLSEFCRHNSPMIYQQHTWDTFYGW